MVTDEDIERLYRWSHEGDAPERVREWHAQVIADLTERILFLESVIRIEFVSKTVLP